MNEILKKALENKKLTVSAFQNELYNEGLDISRQGIAKWLTGETHPAVKSIPIICKVLDIEPNSLFLPTK